MTEGVYELIIPNVQRAKRRSTTPWQTTGTVIIDNGSHELRAGFAEEEDPCLRFPNQLIRPRARWSTEFETLVGESHFNVKGFDLGRAAVRSPFDSNVVVNFDTQEAILDYVFDRLGFEESVEGNGVVMTECLLNPEISRKTMLELMFEAYGVPHVVFVPDCLAAFYRNREVGRCSSNCIVLCSGHSATHVVPIIDNKAHLQYMQRSKICGSQATAHLHQMTMLHNPQCATSLSKQMVELMKEQCSICSQDYSGDLKRIAEKQEADSSLGLKIQLPKTTSAARIPSEESSLDNYADKAMKAEENRLRLKAMSFKRKQKIINEKEELVAYLKEIRQQVMQTDEEEVIVELLEEAEVGSVDELEKTIATISASLERLSQPEEAPIGDGTPTVPSAEEEDIETMRARYREVSERLEQRKRGRFGLDRESGPSSKRVSSEQRRRMKLVAEAAAKDDDDDFGADDKDWDVYKEMDPYNPSDIDLDRTDETELKSLREKLHQMGDVVEEKAPLDMGHSYVMQQLDENQLYLSIERMRIPELLFQPSLMGIDQAGIAEITSRVLKSLPAEVASLVDREIILCGGNASYEGLDTRLETEMRCLRPYGRPMKVIRAQDFFLDGWYGAAHYARTPSAMESAYTLAEYEEYGSDALPRKPIPFVYYM